MKRLIVCCFIAASVLLLFISCSFNVEEETGGRQGSAEDVQLDSIINVLSYYGRMGMHDSVVMMATPYVREALMEDDTATALYTGVMAAQSFLFLDDTDSLKRYIDLIAPIIDMPGYSLAKIIYYNVVGSYWLRVDLDYSKALNNYLEGLHWAESVESENNQIALLSNIVNIFYLLDNPNGIEYAERAYKIASSSKEINGYTKSATMIIMAQMLYLQGRYDEALRYLDAANKYVLENKAASSYAVIDIIYARIYEGMGLIDRALGFYEKAVRSPGITDPGTMSNAFLHYGSLLEKIGRTQDAMDAYRDGLAVSYKSENLEFRKEILSRAAELSFGEGRKEESYGYSHQYRLLVNSITDPKASEFNELLLTIQDMKHDSQILEQKLERQKMEKHLTITVLIAIIALALAISVLYVHHRQRKAYRTIVEQHRSYIKKLDSQSISAKSSQSACGSCDADTELFIRIEYLMRVDKFYLRKDISLELMAEELATNRTYCSRAINNIAKMSFNKYVDSFRIEEATRRIAAKGSDILFKQLADDLGYNSVTVFHKAFIREIGCSPGVYRKEVIAISHEI